MISQNLPFPQEQDPTVSGNTNASLGYKLSWRLRKLVVHFSPQQDTSVLPRLLNRDWLVECLKRSPVQSIKLDIAMGEANLKAWAEACYKAGKPAYLCLLAGTHLPQKQSPLIWRMKRAFDWIGAALLLLLLSPLMISLTLLIKLLSPGPIFYQQWRVGERGKLFRIIKFRTMVVGAERLHHQVMGYQSGLHKLKEDPRVTTLGRWMRRYSLDELPQLFNVLRGEMSLVGPRPWAFYDAIRIAPELRHRLNALPGITGAWQVESRATVLDISTVNLTDLNYLISWSPWQDLKFLVLTIPKVLSGFGAY
jgi:lipopolysaccharide/colanic/teichoic acid biosynthesis glycosyltransferase